MLTSCLPSRVVRGACLGALLFIQGCAHMWARNYNDYLDGDHISNFSKLSPTYDEPQLIESTDVNAEVRSLEERGYVEIGFSQFLAGEGGFLGARIHARRMDASVVVAGKTFVSGSTYNIVVEGAPQTVTTTHSGTVYGSGGVASYSGTTSTTVPGAPRTLPIVVTLYRYLAVYMVEYRHLLGVLWEDLTQEDRAAIGRNVGVKVRVVVRDSPAYLADLMPGDIVTAVGGDVVRDIAQVEAALWDRADTSVPLTVRRGNKQMKVSVKLPPPPPPPRAPQERRELGDDW